MDQQEGISHDNLLNQITQMKSQIVTTESVQQVNTSNTQTSCTEPNVVIQSQAQANYLEAQQQYRKHNPEPNEQLWKRKLIEHDIRLQDAKMQMMELHHSLKIQELNANLKQLQAANQILAKERDELEKQKQQTVCDLQEQIRQLEYYLISANMEIADIQSQLQVERNLVLKLQHLQDVKKPGTESYSKLFLADIDESPERLGDDDQEYNRPHLSSGKIKQRRNFLRMFKFRRTPDQEAMLKNKELIQSKVEQKLNSSFMGEQSVDYANYLLDIQGERDSFIASASSKNLLQPAPQEIINMDEPRRKTEQRPKQNVRDDLKVKQDSINSKDLDNMIEAANQGQQPIKQQNKEAQPSHQASEPLKRQGTDVHEKAARFQISEDIKDMALAALISRMPDDKSSEVKKWVASYMPQLSSKVTADRENLIQSKAFLKDLNKGIPHEVRGDVWQAMLGNNLRITPPLYQKLLENARQCQINISESEDFRKHLDVIEKDLHRTFADVGHFRKGGFLYQPLKNILCCFSLFRPDIGYVQGMSYLGATLMLHMGDEFQVFSAFCQVMHRNLIFHFYCFEMKKVNVFFNIFMKLFAVHLPKLAKNFEALGLECSMFLFEWTVAVFSNILPLATVSRLWDSWLLLDEFYFMKICLAVCAVLQDKQTDDQPMEAQIMLFKSVGSVVGEKELLAKLDASKLQIKEYEKVKKEIQQQEDNLPKLI